MISCNLGMSGQFHQQLCGVTLRVALPLSKKIKP
jgi:hypothetical protein